MEVETKKKKSKVETKMEDNQKKKLAKGKKLKVETKLEDNQ